MGAVYVVKVGDPVLRSRSVQALLDRLVGDEDRALVVETFQVPRRRATPGDTAPDTDTDTDGEAAEGEAGVASVVGGVVNAALSPPFMTSRRVVVVADYEQLGAAEAVPLVGALDELLDTTDLVFVTGGGRVAKALADALKGAQTAGPESERIEDVLAAEAARTGLTFRNDASKLVMAHLGQDAGRVGALLDVVAAAYGPGATVTAEEVAPYLGEVGSLRPYELTNRIEEGDVAGALEVLHRLLTVTSPAQPKPMHPLQVLAILASRYRKLLALDGPAVRTVADAHAVLGGKGSTFPAKKALEASRALGTDGLRRAMDHLHRADLELKGASALPEQAAMEVLVARLAALHGRSRSDARRRERVPG